MRKGQKKPADGIRKPMGGLRPGLGRKSRAFEKNISDLLQLCWKFEDRKAVIEGLVTQAKGGNVKAAALLLAYAYGKPTERIEHSGSVAHIRLVWTDGLSTTDSDRDGEPADPPRWTN